MADLKVIKPKPFLSHRDIVQFAYDLLEKCQSENVTSIGVCYCYNDGENGYIGYHHASIDPEDQSDLEAASLELRQDIIDSADDYEIME